LNREVAQFESASRAGANRLAGGDVYEPELEAEAYSNILGGASYTLGGSASSGGAQDSREERRRRILEATMSRLKKEDEELEQSCGTVDRDR
jgi:hypothetical protein